MALDLGKIRQTAQQGKQQFEQAREQGQRAIAPVTGAAAAPSVARRPSTAGAPKRALQDPYINLNWWVEIEGLVVATFSEFSGFTVETHCESIRAGGINTHELKFPGSTTYTNLVLKRGMTDSQKLWQWYLDVVRIGQQHKAVRKTVSVMLYDHTQQAPVRTWTFIRAFPVKWVGPELNAETGVVAIETLELSHEGLSRV